MKKPEAGYDAYYYAGPVPPQTIRPNKRNKLISIEIKICSTLKVTDFRHPPKLTVGNPSPDKTNQDNDISYHQCLNDIEVADEGLNSVGAKVSKADDALTVVLLENVPAQLMQHAIRLNQEAAE